MSKPKKTILQLETLIKREAAKTMLLPENVVVSICPEANSWKVVCHSPHPLQDRECYELIRVEADRLKLKFDLNL
jgi:hypothetical protein